MTIFTDVLVIGAGGAGLRAAIAAADCGAQVLLASKKEPGIAGATSYPIAEMAGYNAGDVQIPDDVEAHFRDIIAAGQGMADETLAAVVAANAPETIRQLEAWGVSFDHVGDDYYIFKSCFSTKARTHVIKGHGEPIVKALKKQIELRPNISVLSDFTAVGLLVKDNVCHGVFGALADSEELVIHAKAVILATGGCGQAFEKNMNPSDVTGAGYSLAYYAGSDLVNMEFMQIGIGYSWPVINIFNGYIWETRPKVSDGCGGDLFEGLLPPGLTADAVMHEHRKHFPFSSSDDSKYLEIAIQSAIQQGRAAEHGGVVVDFSQVTDEYVDCLEDDCGIHHMWPVARDYLLSRGVDISRDKVEIACFAHAINGGVKIDKTAATAVKGLFAAGECAGGPHGADRLGGNMMVTCQVFGHIAGISAAEYALPYGGWKEADEESFADLEKFSALLHKDLAVSEKLAQLRQCTQKNLLVNRTEQGLREVLALVDAQLKEIEEAKTSRRLNTAVVDLFHMLTAVKLIAGSAHKRRESRGSHHRADFPQTSAEYAAPIVVNQKSESSSK